MATRACCSPGFKEVQNWNQAELQRWAEAALQKEEDALTLALYQRQDEAKVKDLNPQAGEVGPFWVLGVLRTGPG